jgi:hypothetical protein
MQGRRDVTIFVAWFVSLSAVLGWLFWSAPGSVGYHLNGSMLSVPIVSAMLASVGFSWRRKIVYASVMMGLYLLSGVTAEMAGMHGLASRQLSSVSAFPSLAVVMYMAWLTTFPFVMLVLFVGRRPSLLWSKQENSQV